MCFFQAIGTRRRRLRIGLHCCSSSSTSVDQPDRQSFKLTGNTPAGDDPIGNSTSSPPHDHTGLITSSDDGTKMASSPLEALVRRCQIDVKITVLQRYSESITSVAISSDGRSLASVSYGGRMRLWDGQTQIAVLRGHSGSINSLVFSPDGTTLASGSSDETVRLWAARTGMELAVLRGHTGSVNSVGFSPDGTRIASGSSDATVRLWNAQTGDEIAVLRGHSDSVESVRFLLHGKKLASSSLDKSVRLWGAKTGNSITVPRGDSDLVESVLFSPDGTKMASAAYDGTVQLLESQTSKEIAGFARSSLVGFTLNGSTFLSVNTEKIFQVDCTTGEKSITPVEEDVANIEEVRASGANLWIIRVKKKQPSKEGLLVVQVVNEILRVMPLCWFPPNFPVTGVAISGSSRVVVGCKDGHILLLDIHSFPLRKLHIG